jgi:hypothetical protein
MGVIAETLWIMPKYRMAVAILAGRGADGGKGSAKSSAIKSRGFYTSVWDRLSHSLTPYLAPGDDEPERY